MNILDVTEHRPYDKPDSPWAMTQTWNRLLFAHWPIKPERMRGDIPPGLQLDTYDGWAWLSVVPFDMTQIRLRWLPPIPGTNRFEELNVRTYVKRDGKPGVWFFSLEASNRLAVRGARFAAGLPYMDARISSRRVGPGIEYVSARTQAGAPPARFSARFRPIGAVTYAVPGSLEDWLTARFCLYAVRHKALLRCDIHHLPWPLQDADVEVAENSMWDGLGPTQATKPALAQYADALETFIWLPQRIASI